MKKSSLKNRNDYVKEFKKKKFKQINSNFEFI